MFLISRSHKHTHMCMYRTLTAPVALRDCLEAIKNHAFDSSEYPVVITFEDHLNSRLQAKVAKVCRI